MLCHIKFSLFLRYDLKYHSLERVFSWFEISSNSIVTNSLSLSHFIEIVNRVGKNLSLLPFSCFSSCVLVEFFGAVLIFLVSSAFPPWPLLWPSCGLIVARWHWIRDPARTCIPWNKAKKMVEYSHHTHSYDDIFRLLSMQIVQCLKSNQSKSKF